MNQITEDYVSFEVAKLLKEKGFDELCIKKYNKNGFLQNAGNKIEEWQNSELDEDEYSAPTLQMALKWLRERQKIAYNIFVFSDGGLGELHYCYEIQEIDNELLQCNGSLDTEGKDYESYEQATEAAILYVLKNLI